MSFSQNRSKINEEFENVNFVGNAKLEQISSLDFLKGRQLTASKSRIQSKFNKHKNQFDFENISQFSDEIDRIFERNWQNDPHYIILKQECNNQITLFNLINCIDKSTLIIFDHESLKSSVTFLTYYKKTIGYFRSLLLVGDILDQETTKKIEKIVKRADKKTFKKHIMNLRKIHINQKTDDLKRSILKHVEFNNTKK